MRPGIPNTHPWNMGIRPPRKPMITSKIPSEIFSASLIIKMGLGGYSYSENNIWLPFYISFYKCFIEILDFYEIDLKLFLLGRFLIRQTHI